MLEEYKNTSFLFDSKSLDKASRFLDKVVGIKWRTGRLTKEVVTSMWRDHHGWKVVNVGYTSASSAYALFHSKEAALTFINERDRKLVDLTNLTTNNYQIF